MTLWLVALAAALGSTVAAVVWGLGTIEAVQSWARSRWKEHARADLPPSAEKGPQERRRSRWTARFWQDLRRLRVPSFVEQWLPEALIVAAGWPHPPETYRALTWLLLQAGGGVEALLVLARLSGWIGGGTFWLGSALNLGVLFWGPWWWIRRAKRRRQRQIQRALPDFLDMLTLAVEAGLGFEPALEEVARRFPGPWGSEMRRALQRIALGVPRDEALREAAERVDVNEALSFVEALYLAHRLGTPLSRSLRIQSQLLRTRRRQQAQTLAHTAPIRLIPALVFFFLPSLLLLYLAPPLLYFFFGR